MSSDCKIPTTLRIVISKLFKRLPSLKLPIDFLKRKYLL